MQPSVAVALALALALGLTACSRDGERVAPSAAPTGAVSSRPESASPGSLPETPPSSGATASASASAAPSSPPLTVRGLRAESAKDKAAFDGKAVTLEGFYLGTSQITFGSGEHPRHTFVVARFTLERGGADVLECWFDERSGPAAHKAGDAIVVTGKWSFGQVMAGGIVESGGALHLTQCRTATWSSPP